MKKVFLILSLIAVLSGCSNTIGNRNMPTSQSRAIVQMAEITDKSEVREKFGTPNLIFTKDGDEVYEYKQISGSGRYNWMLPIVGWIMSWWQDEYTYTETNLFITFDDKDNVKDWRLVETGGTTD